VKLLTGYSNVWTLDSARTLTSPAREAAGTVSGLRGRRGRRGLACARVLTRIREARLVLDLEHGHAAHAPEQVADADEQDCEEDEDDGERGAGPVAAGAAANVVHVGRGGLGHAARAVPPVVAEAPAGLEVRVVGTNAVAAAGAIAAREAARKGRFDGVLLCSLSSLSLSLSVAVVVVDFTRSAEGVVHNGGGDGGTYTL